MAGGNGSSLEASPSWGQLQHLASAHSSPILLTAVSLALTTLVVYALAVGSGRSRQPPALPDPIPGLFNGLQFFLYNEAFMNRVRKYMVRSPILTFWQARKRVYLVSGRKNVQTVFAKWRHINNEGIMLELNLPTWYRFTKADVRRWATDRSGRARNPLPGTEGTPHHQRYFHGYEHVHTEYLSKPQWLNPLVDHYHGQIRTTLESYDYHGGWSEVSVLHWWRHDVTRCAVHTMLGPKIFEVRPDFCHLFWDFDERIFDLAIGFPKWMYPTPHRVQREYLDALQGYLDAAYQNFDYNDPAALEAPWEPDFGAQVSRQVVDWFKKSGFTSKDTAAGALGILVWAENSNAIPIGEWMLMEVARDADLRLALREEVKSAYNVDPVTGRRTLDLKKFGALPLLSSVYHESLRMSMSYNMIRDVAEEFELDKYKIKKGSWVQVPTLVAHYDEDAWGVPDHPATEFWAERNIKYVEEKDDMGNVSRKRVFDMSGRSGSYFPYGGGNLICPGRQFAKQEITLTVGLLLEMYDFEFSRWVKLDGSPSDRGARHFWQYCGSGSAPPDRDMIMKIRRAADST